jgi:3-methylcrotonyl-CoA carboxylase alpha subunit
VLYTYEYNGQTLTVRLERRADGGYLAEIDGQPYNARAWPLAAGGWLLEIDGARAVVHVAAAGSARYVHARGHNLALERLTARSQRRGPGSAAGDLTAQMPGQVVAVLVSPGDAVQSGQALIVLEAMKMEIRIGAPRSGTVGRVLVETGDLVERGQALVELTAES